jgi:exodeoxyribonuclease-5
MGAVELSEQQETCVSRAVAFAERGPDPLQPVFSLGGCAGTGKTTVAKMIADRVRDASGGQVLFCAPTGKAAHVLTHKGCPATTIHKLIYQQAGDPPTKAQIEKLRTEVASARAARDAISGGDEWRKLDAEMTRLTGLLIRMESEADRKGPRFRLNTDSEVRYAELVIVDECSMVDGRVATDLESFGVPIIALGDPAQLPPVGAASHWTRRDPDFVLDQIHRQSAGSPIIQLATRVRTGQQIHYADDGAARVVRKSTEGLEQLVLDTVRADGQILVGRNATRHASNAKIRRLLGRGTTPIPVAGDRLICLRNNHELGLLNGTMWTCVDFEIVDDATGLLTAEPDDGGPRVRCTVWRHAFEGREHELGPVRRECEEFAFGYAITVHKSQGSEWDSVVLFDESSAFGRDAWRHLYTGITRAAKQLTVVR